MYKKYLLVDVLKPRGICQLPANVSNRYLEILLVENDQPIDLTDCRVEVTPTQETVEILKDKKGVILIKVLDSIQSNFNFQLKVYQQKSMRATTSFDIELEMKQEINESTRNHKNQSLFSHNRVRLIAHRGLSTLAPENTLPAYELAGKYGYFGAECDIYETSDGEFMLMHDPIINRTTNGTGSVSHYTKAQLKEFHITESGYPHLRIPTLTEYLQVCKGQGLIPVIEIKHIEVSSITRLLHQIEEWGLTCGCIIITFHQGVATEVRKQNKEIGIQWLADLTKENIDYCAQYQMNIDCDKKTAKRELIEYAHSVGVLVNVWTVNEEKEMMKFIEMGVDFITTNGLMYRQTIRSTGICESYRMKNRIDYLRCLNPFLIESHIDDLQEGTFKWHEEIQIFEMKGTKKSPATLDINLPKLYKGDVVTVSGQYLNLSESCLNVYFGTTKMEFEQVMETNLVGDWGYVEVQFIVLKDSQGMREDSHMIMIGNKDANAHFMMRNINVRVDYM